MNEVEVEIHTEDKLVYARLIFKTTGRENRYFLIGVMAKAVFDEKLASFQDWTELMTKIGEAKIVSMFGPDTKITPVNYENN